MLGYELTKMEWFKQAKLPRYVDNLNYTTTQTVLDKQTIERQDVTEETPQDQSYVQPVPQAQSYVQTVPQTQSYVQYVPVVTKPDYKKIILVGGGIILFAILLKKVIR